MSGYEFDEYGDPVETIELDPVTEAYYTDPVAFMNGVIENTAREVREEVSQQIDAQVNQAQMMRLGEVTRAAGEAMDAAYPDWTKYQDRIADRVRIDAAANRVPYHDEKALAEYYRDTYILERELAKPSPAEAAAAYSQSLLELAERERNPWTS